MCGAALWGIRDARARCGAARFFASRDPPLVACAGPLFGAFEMRALVAGPLVSSPLATHLSWHVRGRSLGHSRCARSLWGRSFLRLSRPTSCGMRGAALWGIRDARAPCGDARLFASRDPPLVACAGPLFGAFEMRALLVGPLVSSPLATHLSWHVRGPSWGIRDARAPCGTARFFASRDPP